MAYHGVGWGDGFWMIGGLLLLVALIVAVVWAANAFSRPYRGDRDSMRDPSRPTATEILRERFARGEITEEQFEQAKKVLGPDR